MKQWRKSSRWRAARRRAVEKGDVRLWIKLCRMQRGVPVFGVKTGLVEKFCDEYLDSASFFMASAMIEHAGDVLSMPGKFPKNAGNTAIRFFERGCGDA